MDKKDDTPQDDSYERAEAELMKAADEVEKKVTQTKLSRRGKIKRHFHDNSRVYIAAAGGLLVGAGIATIYCLKSGKLVNTKQIQVLAYKSTQKLEIWIEALGDPGNIIQDTTTGTIFASQGEAARTLGLNPTAISNQLNGRSAHVKGHIFKKLGKAGVTPTSV